MLHIPQHNITLDKFAINYPVMQMKLKTTKDWTSREIPCEILQQLLNFVGKNQSLFQTEDEEIGKLKSKFWLK